MYEYFSNSKDDYHDKYYAHVYKNQEAKRLYAPFKKDYIFLGNENASKYIIYAYNAYSQSVFV